MDTTPILNKPVIYGGDLENFLFIALVVTHVLVAIAAVASGLAALATRKGGAAHVRWGQVFLYTLAGTAISGIILDAIRLTFWAAENHASYPGASMPSTYPARFAFGYAGFCILYMLYQATPLDSRPAVTKSRLLWMPAAFVVAGIALTVLIYTRFNPWTGGLWMIWTFTCLIFATAYYRLRGRLEPARRVDLHRFVMLALIAFSWWGAWQGFRPAIVAALAVGVTVQGPYTGDQPGPYSPAFWHFLRGWLPPLAAGAVLLGYFSRRRARTMREGT